MSWRTRADSIQASIGPQLDEISVAQLTNSDIAKLLPEGLKKTSRNESDNNYPISGESSGMGGSLASSTFPSCFNINSDHTTSIRSNSSSFSAFSEISDKSTSYEEIPLKVRQEQKDYPSNLYRSHTSQKSSSLENVSSTSKEAKFGFNEEITNNSNKSTVDLPAKLKKCGKGIMIDAGNSFEINGRLRFKRNYRNRLDLDQESINVKKEVGSVKAEINSCCQSRILLSSMGKELESVKAEMSSCALILSSMGKELASVKATNLCLDRRLINVEKGKGELSKNKGEKNEKEIRKLVANIKGEDYSKRVKCNNLIDAVENISVVSGLSNVSQGSTLDSCKKVVNYFKDHDIYKELLSWFYDQTKIRAQKNHNLEFENFLKLNPWVVQNKLSLNNVRDSIVYLDQDLKDSLKFLVKDPLWENHEFFSTSSGPGLILAMFSSVYQTCPNILSFPPATEIEQDCRGKIIIQSGTVRIEIGEIKSSKKGVPDAKKQLKRSLLFSLWLHKMIHVQPYEYELRGDIFLFGGRNCSTLQMNETDKVADNIIQYTKFIFCESEEGSAGNN